MSTKVIYRNKEEGVKVTYIKTSFDPAFVIVECHELSRKYNSTTEMFASTTFDFLSGRTYDAIIHAISAQPNMW